MEIVVSGWVLIFSLIQRIDVQINETHEQFTKDKYNASTNTILLGFIVEFLGWCFAYQKSENN